jgi:hypothetical protein
LAGGVYRSNSSSLLAYFNLMRKSAKAVLLTRLGDTKPIVPAFFGDQFVEKEGSLPLEKVIGLEIDFLLCRSGL